MQIIGKGGFGKEVAAYCELYNIVSFNFENECKGLIKSRDAIIAIGSEEVRRQIVDEFNFQSWGVLNFGKSYDALNKIGVGSIICPNTILTTNVKIGKHCVINLSCTVGHDVEIDDFVTINPGVNISGNVSIGANCNIGSNAVIRNGIKICEDVTVGAGSVVVKDITTPGIYVGNPAIRMDLRPKYIEEKDFVAATKDVMIKFRQEKK